MAPYRPSGRSGRSGRSQADNDIFEGLPVKQWSTQPSRISLAPPASEQAAEQAQDKWADPPMPRDFQLLLPHTQSLLRIARSGKVGTKRKAQPELDPDGDDFGEREDNAAAEEVLAKAANIEERGFVAKKWQHTPDASLVPEHKHWEFLAKRRKGLPNFYHGLATEVAANGMPQLAKRRARIQRVLDAATGESAIYEVLALEGQVLENELPADSQLPSTAVAAGTTIDGLGTANEDGVIVLVPANLPAPSRRNRPPPKKKGGPGRGKKRVTFTNPDGSTYTTIVPNATKIVPLAGQTVKHVAKGEDAGKDVSIEEAAKLAQEAPDTQNGDGGQGEAEGEGEGDDDGEDDDEGDDDEGDDDDDREEGEIADDDAEVATPARPKSAKQETPVIEPAAAPATEGVDVEMEDESTTEVKAVAEAEPEAAPAPKDASSSPELPLAQSAPTHSRQNSLVAAPPATQDVAANELENSPAGEENAAIEPEVAEAPDAPAAVAETEAGEVPANPDPAPEAEVEPVAEAEAEAKAAEDAQPAETFDDGDEDLLGSLERHLES